MWPKERKRKCGIWTQNFGLDERKMNEIGYKKFRIEERFRRKRKIQSLFWPIVQEGSNQFGKAICHLKMPNVL
jgi:hypothetical protein